MPMSKSRHSIVTHESKAYELRRVAREFGFLYAENPIDDSERPGLIRFVFQVSDDDALKLARAVPNDVFAYQAYMV
jgi:hypothetical protein